MVEVDGRAIYPGFQFPQQPVVMMPGHQVILFTMTMRSGYIIHNDNENYNDNENGNDEAWRKRTNQG